MGLQNRESSYIQAVSDRWDIALPQNLEVVIPSGDDFPQECVLYLPQETNVSFVTAGYQAHNVTFPAGFVPLRVIRVTSATDPITALDLTIFRAY